MQLKKTTVNFCRSQFDLSLPNLLDVILGEDIETYLIGAGVFDVYLKEGWIEKFSRQTGDLDFTMNYIGDQSAYKRICQNLQDHYEYVKDDVHPYRYHPPKMQGIYAYVDLLTFTTDKELASQARGAMNVGEGFSFEGMDFAALNSLKFINKIFLPNPLAFIYLKMRSYFHNPNNRKKDFVDLLELILRISTQKNSPVVLSELKKSFTQNKNQFVKNEIEKLCYSLEKDSGGLWDLEDIKQDYAERRLDEEFLLDDIPQFIEFFRMQVVD